MAKLDDLIQQKQQRDEDWKAKKTAEREELGQLSDDAVMHVTSEPGAYLHYLDTQAINPRYSASNVMLAMAQNPDITYINSLEVWNRLGRSVNRDENGMKIRVSDTYVKDGREYHGYKIGRVFDISQTHGKAGVPALSLKDNTPEMDAALRRLLDSSPVPVVTSSTMYQDAVYDPKTQSITVSSRLIDSKIFAALSREIVHAGIHDHGRYPYYTREDCAMDAESVSYMLCRNFGVETPQPDVSRVGQVFDGMEVQDRRGVVDSLQKYFRKLQNDNAAASLLPYSTIEAAASGNVDAINAVLKHYERYIAALATRTLYDENGVPHLCLDEEKVCRMRTKLITKILDFKVNKTA